MYIITYYQEKVITLSSKSSLLHYHTTNITLYQAASVLITLSGDTC